MVLNANMPTVLKSLLRSTGSLRPRHVSMTSINLKTADSFIERSSAHTVKDATSDMNTDLSKRSIATTIWLTSLP